MISHFWKKIRAKSIAFWFIYIVILLYSVMNDLHFFDFTYADTGSYYEASGNPYAKMFYFTLKTAFAVLLYFFMNMISRGFTAVRNKNRDSRRRLIFVLIIMIVYIIFLILCWPGVWWCSGADEFKMVDFISHLQVQYHQVHGGEHVLGGDVDQHGVDGLHRQSPVRARRQEPPQQPRRPGGLPARRVAAAHAVADQPALKVFG